MGFNTWTAYGCNISASLIKQTALALHTNGMQAAGYTYVNIDDCWIDGSTPANGGVAGRTADGHLIPNPTSFPPSTPGKNDGIKVVADYVHSLGLKLGLYQAAAVKTCAGFAGSYGHENTDAKDFAAWGVDYLKYDNCAAPPGTADNQQQFSTRFKRMSDALLASGRPIVFGLCEWGKSDPWQWGPYQANLGRSSQDIQPNYRRVLKNFTDNAMNPPSPYAPLYFNDPDSLQIGTGYGTILNADASAGSTNIKVSNTRKAVRGSLVRIETGSSSETAVVTTVGTPGAEGTGLTLATPLTKNHPKQRSVQIDGLNRTEAQTQMSLWAIQAAPLISGADIINMAPENLAIYTNRDVIAVDQDPLGRQGRVVSSGSHWVLVKPLASGSYAVVLFNASDTEWSGAAATLQSLGLDPARSYASHDLWAKARGVVTGAVRAGTLPAHSSVMLTLQELPNQ
ncbi:glycoside hydrolase family 27 protein [Streptomyces goshikiensis]|uniref:glycoside hydrolase family 27 protein n=1 Tax=Streptomyces goshikiensis TaxID=1942 RepID=UPI0036F9FB9E